MPKFVARVWELLQEFLVVGSPAASSPLGRRLRVRRLIRNGTSPERAWAAVITRDVARGETHFTAAERTLLKKIHEEGMPAK